MGSYPSIYRAYVVDSSSAPARVLVPQLFNDVSVPLFSSAGSTPVSGEMGWVMFANGEAERPVWMGSSASEEPGI